jgi:UDP-N-acetylmuramoyl-tripeptide--D-alanyl-D-alanine ligase
VALLAPFGARSRAIAEGAAAAGLPADRIFHTEEVDALIGWARERLLPSDLLLVKASRGMKLERLVEALR